jgi:flagellum-specific ATP synthase/type III secretion protein N (ATPase)
MSAESRRRFNRTGKVCRVKGDLIYATIPEPFVGELYQIGSLNGGTIEAEVVGFQGDAEHSESLLMPFSEVRHIAQGANATSIGGVLQAPVGMNLLGRILDGLGRSLDGDGLVPEGRTPVYAESPHPLLRKRIREQLPFGIKAIDTMLPCGCGQRVGIFAAAGGGKSTLMGMIARFTAADVKVIVLAGERGREVLEFKEDCLGKSLASSVLVVATSDQPAVVRIKAAYTGVAIAEYFRDKGLKVLLMMDSVTRFARAQREIGLARGEPPTRRGFPPSVFSELPRLFERCGNSTGTGSITGVFTVLVEGDDFDEPVTDETKSLLDGHIILSDSVPYRPRIDLLRSESRVRSGLRIEERARTAADRIMGFLRYYQRVEPDIAFGFLEGAEGNSAKEKIAKLKGAKAKVDKFMEQHYQEAAELSATIDALAKTAADLPSFPAA